ncbi:hypothetical protein INQ17_22980, partial [Escherichia coli]|nr:hypothetical protein [Escherichia coli]
MKQYEDGYNVNGYSWENETIEYLLNDKQLTDNGFAPIFPDTCYHLTHYWPAAADIPV